MDRIGRISSGIARNILSGTKWESPRGDRKTWRKKKDDGGYEYRDTPPDEKGKQEKKPDAEVVKTRAPSPFKKEMLGEKVDDGVRRFKSGKDFKNVISHLKENHSHGAAVDVYDEYPDDWKLMSNEAGDALVAVKPDGDIVSVVRANESKTKFWGTTAARLGVKSGGKKLDCFDTNLPGAYARAGMRPVARIPWNEEHKPEGWEYEKFYKYNKGKPDVVFMVYDGTTTEYNPDDAIRVDSYAAGQLAQEEFLKSLGKKKEGSMKKQATGKLKLPLDHMPNKEEEAELNELLVKELMKNHGFTREEAQAEVDLC